MSSKKTSRAGTLIAFGVSIAVLVGAALLYINRQYIIDSYTVWSYEPSSDVQVIQANAELTDKGRFVFYATRPSVEQQSSFNQECPRQEEGSPILGCYTTDDRIYIYDLTNKQLAGMEEVTAVHEMLHAVWSRMDQDEKDKLTAELKDAYSRIDNKELKARMEYYERTEPGELYNELHSILGTEFSSLGEPLESYYSQYFDRSAILALHSKYSDLYTGLYNRADTLYSQMETLATSIQDDSKAYKSAVEQYTAAVSSFNSRANNNGFTSQSQFNQERAALVSRSTELKGQRQEINANIKKYNIYYKEYETIAQQIEVLNESIDSFNQIDQVPSV